MEALEKYYLQLADNALILSHRLSENCSKGPFLEEDLATTNVALDLIGLAESIYVHLSEGKEHTTADDLAYKRDEWEYRNVLLVEQENGDFSQLMARQFLMDVFHFHLFTALKSSKDSFLSGITEKSLKEVKYHLKRSTEWMIRFGLGTEESNLKVKASLSKLWPYIHDLFLPSEAELILEKEGVIPPLDDILDKWMSTILETFNKAGLELPATSNVQTGGKNGIHTEKLGYILTEMQYLPNKYPTAVW